MAANVDFSNADRERIFDHIINTLLRQNKSTRFYTALKEIYGKRDPTDLVILKDNQIVSRTYTSTDGNPGQPFSMGHGNLLRVFRDFVWYKASISKHIPPTLEGWLGITSEDFYD